MAKINPKSATVSIGESVPFSIDPTPNAPVTYAVTGSAAGNVTNAKYVGSKAGTDTVTASTNGNVIDTATVIVTA